VSIKSVDEFWSVTLPLLGRSVGRLAVLNMFYNLVSVMGNGRARYIVEMARFRRPVGSCKTAKRIDKVRRIRRL
jgi:ABC-type microcin C transport system permease subunit YejB